MNIVFIINSLHRGGAETMLANILSANVFSKDCITVVALQSGGVLSDQIVRSGHKVVHLGANKSLVGFLRLLKLPLLIARIRPDVVHSWLYQSDLASGFAALLTGIRPVIWSIRQTDISFKHNKLNTIACAKTCAWLSHFVPHKIISNSKASVSKSYKNWVFTQQNQSDSKWG